MRGTKRRLASVAATLILVGGVTVAMSATNSVAAIERCSSRVDNRPVVLTVHGLWGSPDTFSDKGLTGSMNESISLVRKANLVTSFDYKDYSSKWVTDEHIGKALAERINCLSDASREVGGDGRIIVVAHSMGGLALREALNRANPVYVKSENIGLAVMIGTPHKGAPMAKWCNPTGCGWIQPAVAAMRPGSRQVRVLPKLPATVPQRAIAGRTIGYSGLGFDDGVVSVRSATDEYTTAYSGDGRFEMNCLQLWPWQKPSCHHQNLLKNAGVQAMVIQALGEYVNSLPDPEPTPSPSTPTPTPSSSDGCEQPSPSATPTEEVIGGVGGEPSATPCP